MWPKTQTRPRHLHQPITTYDTLGHSHPVLSLCVTAGYAVSQVRPEFVSGPHSGELGMVIGFGFGGLLIAVDEMLKAFPSAPFPPPLRPAPGHGRRRAD